MKILVGYTGFVGSNLAHQVVFDKMFNSSNIDEAYGLNPDILVYSGVPAEKFLANSDPERDVRIIENAIENIKKINPKKIILISTVDVYPVPDEVNEENTIGDADLQPYGKNRLYLEKWVEKEIDDHLILRLPALFGNNLKKNFIYDIINIVPSMLSQKLYNDLSPKAATIAPAYTLQPNGFYKLGELTAPEKQQLKQDFLNIGFTALNFTDSRAVFQFYNLGNLWADINTALSHNIKKLNLATEPVSAGEIYKAVFGETFINEMNGPLPYYNFHTIHAPAFGDDGNYIKNKETVISEIKSFINAKIK